jgi:dihydroneopterin aldolase
MDSIFIEGLRVSCIIGTNAWEQLTPQELLIDIEMRTDISAAATSDDLTKALDYHAVSERIIELCEANKARLLEVLADQIANRILEEFDTDFLRLRINKPAAIPAATAIGLVIERSKES